MIIKGPVGVTNEWAGDSGQDRPSLKGFSGVHGGMTRRRRKKEPQTLFYVQKVREYQYMGRWLDGWVGSGTHTRVLAHPNIYL